MNITLIIIVLVLILVAGWYFLSKKSGVQSGAGNDAAMFARLLVSEIKLYNEQKVQLGVQNKSLSETLRDEIEQARKTYQSRFPNQESESHFENALIEVLADGDRSKFGSEIKSCFR